MRPFLLRRNLIKWDDNVSKCFDRNKIIISTLKSNRKNNSPPLYCLIFFEKTHNLLEKAALLIVSYFTVVLRKKIGHNRIKSKRSGLSRTPNITKIYKLKI